MGLFSFLKPNKKPTKTNKDIVYEYHGYDELPKDYDVLEKMFNHYDDLYLETKNPEHEEARFMIAKKWKEVGDNQNPYDPTNRSRFVYSLYFGTEEDLAAYYFDEFIKFSRKTVIDSSTLANRKNAELFQSTLFGASHSSYTGNAFEYHEGENLTKEEKRENAFVEYYENHFDELIDVIFELIDKQEEGEALTYTGYYMYKDLYQFFVDSEQRFSKKIWVSAKEYNEHCSNYYDNYLLFKIKSDKDDYDILMRRNQMAINNKAIYDRDILYAFAKNYISSRRVINTINHYSYIYEDDDERNKIFNQIVDLSKNVRFTTKQGNRIAIFLRLLADKYEDDQSVEKISDYLKDINRNRIKTSLDGENKIPTEIGSIDKKKRELYAEKHHLPSFKIVFHTLSFGDERIDTCRYYETSDGKWMIETDILSLYEYKEGDLLESIESGERFEVDYIVRISEKNIIWKIGLSCDHKYVLSGNETFVKIN